MPMWNQAAFRVHPQPWTHFFNDYPRVPALYRQYKHLVVCGPDLFKLFFFPCLWPHQWWSSRSMLDGLALFRLLLILWPKISMDRELNHHPPNKLLFRRMALCQWLACTNRKWDGLAIHPSLIQTIVSELCSPLNVRSRISIKQMLII